MIDFKITIDGLLNIIILLFIWYKGNKIQSDRFRKDRQLSLLRALAKRKIDHSIDIDNEFSGALNLIPIEFCEYPNVINAHKNLINCANLGTICAISDPARHTQEFLRHKNFLIKEMGAALSIKLDGADIQNSQYSSAFLLAEKNKNQNISDAYHAFLQGNSTLEVKNNKTDESFTVTFRRLHPPHAPK